MPIASRRIHLVCGKGGVGRSSVAAALAEAAAGLGKRVLLSEIADAEGGPSTLGRRFGRESLGPDPVGLGPEGLEGCQLSATRGQELFVRSVIPAGPMVRAALRSKGLRRFIDAVPSLFELGVFYHLLMLLEARGADGRPLHEVLVVDMPATGQTLGLTSLPEVLLSVLPSGPIPDTMRQGQAYLNDPKLCLAWVVTLPELLPVTEALELVEGLEATDVATAGLLLNRVPEDPFEPEEEEVLEELFAEQSLHGELAFRRLGAAREARALLRASTELPVYELAECPGDSPDALRAALRARLAALMESP